MASWLRLGGFFAFLIAWIFLNHIATKGRSKKRSPERLLHVGGKPGSGSAGVDIIFVHGLGSDQVRAWSSSKTLDECWIPNFLQKDLDQAFPNTVTTYLYGYDSAWMIDAAVIDLGTLAQKLRDTIEVRLQKRRKVIFVAHSHGGLVVKKALTIDALAGGKIVSRTLGILFFGTPHYGSHTVVIAKAASFLFSAWGSDASILRSLEPGSGELWQLQEDFKNATSMRTFRIWNFYEEKKTVMFDYGYGLRYAAQIVTQTSATLQPANCENKPFYRDHRGLNKFAARNTEYYIVLAAVKACINTDDDVRYTEDDKAAAIEKLSFTTIDSRERNIALPHRNTCKWVFERDEYKQWRSRQDVESYNGVLWIKGKPGSGKSTLLKHIFDRYDDSSHVRVSYFFNARGDRLEKSPLGMFRSIILQMIEKDEVLCSNFILFHRHRAARSNIEWDWRVEDLQHFLLTNMASSLRGILLFIDALDECNEKEVARVVTFLESYSSVALENHRSVSICLSSRHYPTITINKHLEIAMENTAHDEDIALYIREKLGFQDTEIQQDLERLASGVFMWAVLVVRILNNAYTSGAMRNVIARLEELPPDLDDLFAQIITKGNLGRRTVDLCLWMLFSERPLSATELYYAVLSSTSREIVAVSDGEDEVAIANFINHESKGLVEIGLTQFGAKLQFIHQSVPDFLLRNNRLLTIDPSLAPNLFGAAHARLAECCFRYARVASLYDVETSHWEQPKYPFAMYSYTKIMFHAEKAQHEGYSQRAILSTAQQGCGLDFFWGIDFRIPSWDIYEVHRNPGLLYWLCRRNHSALFSAALQLDETNVNTQGGTFHTPLQAAAASGSHTMVSKLLAHGADVNACGGMYRTALQAAAYANSLSAVQLLLDNGADPTIQGGRYGCALQAAAAANNLDMKRCLLQAGAPVARSSGDHFSALHFAILHCSVESIRYFLSIGAAVGIDEIGEPTDPYNISMAFPQSEGAKFQHLTFKAGFSSVTPLQLAICTGNLNLVEILLKAGADVNVAAGVCYTALQAACLVWNVSAVQMLLAAGAAVNLRGGHLGSPLQALFHHHKVADDRADLEILEILLDAGADVNALGGHYGSALAAAVQNGAHEAVQVLLSAGADVRVIKDATAVGKRIADADMVGMLETLLSAGADANLHDEYQQAALQIAACGGDAERVKSLLAAGADVDMASGDKANALQEAAFLWKLEVIDVLLKAGANINYHTADHESALVQALKGDDSSRDLVEGSRVVQRLLEAGADINVCGGRLQNALRGAVLTFRPDVVTSILQEKPQLHADDGSCLCTLCEAVSYDPRSENRSNDHEAIPKLLISHGVNVNAPCKASGSALQAAISSALYNDGRKKLILQRLSFLLEHGADVNLYGGEHGTALIAAAWGGMLPVVARLLEAGAKLEPEHEKWGNALQVAAHHGYPKTVKLLLDKGADPYAKTERWESALQAVTESKAESWRKDRVLQAIRDASSRKWRG